MTGWRGGEVTITRGGGVSFVPPHKGRTVGLRPASLKMALDLSVRSRGEQLGVSPHSCRQELKHCGGKRAASGLAAEDSSGAAAATAADENEDTNNNTVITAVNLSKPKAPPDLALDSLEAGVGVGQDTLLSSQQLQLDIAALNLLCLARLQETAAVLAGRRPLPAHTSSSYPLVSSSPLNRRTHRCDEPGCDKVNYLHRKI